MEIPAIYSAYKSGEIRTAAAAFDGDVLSFTNEPEPLSYSFEDKEERAEAVVVDVKGINKGELDDRLLTNVKISGADIWFLTYIKDVEDVFDSFMGNITKVLIPYHTTRNDLVMIEAYDVSDNCIPVAFVSQGRVMARGGETKEVRKVIEEMISIGFTEIMVLDTDSMMTKDDWISINERFSGIIPYVKGKGPEFLDGMSFSNIIYDIDP